MSPALREDISVPGAEGRPRVCFYLPCDEASFVRLPKRVCQYQSWQTAEEGSTYLGRFHWVLQTYLQLVEAGVSVELVNKLPESGIIISHIECFDYGIRPNAKTLLVPMLVDKEIPLPHAVLHITHNPVQRLPLHLSYEYVPPWPQIGLLPRSPDRGDRFENVAFVGYPGNLHPSLASAAFSSRLAALGLRLVIPDPAAWHDFSHIDAVLAVRSFGRTEKHLTKPGLKLFNAWLAGVPAVLGFETAYRSEGNAGTDYLEATDEHEILRALASLAADSGLRRQIVEAGSRQVQLRKESELRMCWMRLFDERIFPIYRRWRRDPLFRWASQLAGSVRERFLWRRPAWFSEDRLRPR